MLQDAGERGDLVFDDFAGLEGCNEILNDTRPDVVADIHRAYFAAARTPWRPTPSARTCPTSPTTASRTGSGSSPRRARGSPGRSPTRCRPPDRPRFVLGSVGPGTKLPTLGHESYARLRDAYTECGRGLIAGGSDALVVETCQDLLQVKAAVLGLRRAMVAEGRRVPIVTNVTVETTGTMLLGSEIGAALTAIEPLGVDLIGLNCATGPAEMSEHLRTLAKHARIPLSVMPNAGLPHAGPARRGVPADARTSWPRRSPGSSATTGCGWSAAAAGRPRRTSARSPRRSRRSRPRGATRARSRASARSTRRCRSARTPRCSWWASAPTPTAARPSARRCSPSAGRTASRWPASRPATART